MKDFLFGGEFYYDSKGLSRKKHLLPIGYPVSGGRTAIHLILKYMKKRGVKRALLPSYLCPSIIDEFEKKNIPLSYYSIHEDFSFDKNEISNQIDRETIVYFINFFGLSMDESDFKYIKKLQDDGINLIYDGVHDLIEREMATFSFGSYRKLAPYSVSILKSPYNLDEEYSQLGYNRLYYEAVNNARELKQSYIVEGRGQEKDYLEMFRRSEKYYYEEYSVANSGDVEKLSRMDFHVIAQKKKRNYTYLLEGFIENKYVECIFKNTEQNIPFCMPVYVKVLDRDRVKNALSQEGIFLPVHWNLSADNRILSKESIDMSKKILSIPVDYRYSLGEIEKFLSKFNRTLEIIGGNCV